MIAGEAERFAIEAEIEERVEGWVLGHFRFWICGDPVGDWTDSVDLLGCLRWLKDFCDHPRNRYEAGLFELPPRQVFDRVFDPVMAGSKRHVGLPEVRDAYSRFHISHLGMSSLERFDILLLTDEHGAGRCLWRELDNGQIHDCRFRAGEMEAVVDAFCGRLEQAVAQL